MTAIGVTAILGGLGWLALALSDDYHFGVGLLFAIPLTVGGIGMLIFA